MEEEYDNEFDYNDLDEELDDNDDEDIDYLDSIKNKNKQKLKNKLSTSLPAVRVNSARFNLAIMNSMSRVICNICNKELCNKYFFC